MEGGPIKVVCSFTNVIGNMLVKLDLVFCSGYMCPHIWRGIPLTLFLKLSLELDYLANHLIVAFLRTTSLLTKYQSFANVLRSVEIVIEDFGSILLLRSGAQLSQLVPGSKARLTVRDYPL